MHGKYGRVAYYPRSASLSLFPLAARCPSLSQAFIFADLTCCWSKDRWQTLPGEWLRLSQVNPTHGNHLPLFLTLFQKHPETESGTMPRES